MVISDKVAYHTFATKECFATGKHRWRMQWKGHTATDNSLNLSIGIMDHPATQEIAKVNTFINYKVGRCYLSHTAF